MLPMTVERGSIVVQRDNLGNVMITTLHTKEMLDVQRADLPDLLSAIIEIQRANDSGEVSKSRTKTDEMPPLKR